MNKILTVFLLIISCVVSCYASVYDVVENGRTEVRVDYIRQFPDIASDLITLEGRSFESTEIRFINIDNDSLFSVSQGRTSILYSMHGDTVSIARVGMPGRLLKAQRPSIAHLCGQTGIIQTPVCYNGVTSGLFPIAQLGIETLHAPEPRTLITPEGDTIFDCRLIRRVEFGIMRIGNFDTDLVAAEFFNNPSATIATDSVAYTSTDYYIMAPGYMIPMVERHEKRLFYQGICSDSIFQTDYVPLYEQSLSPEIVERIQNRSFNKSTAGHCGPASSTIASNMSFGSSVFHGELSMRLSSDATRPVEVVVADNIGRVWNHLVLMPGQSQNIDTSDYIHGVYVISCNDGQEIISYQIFKP